MALAVRDDIRLAGRVIRYSTWPHIRQQSVAEHSWQLLRIVIAIWPDVPAHVMRYIVTHDVGEITTGDLPYPIKANNPVLKAEVDRLEHTAQQELCVGWMLGDAVQLTDDEAWAVKLAEFIEMWEWGWEEELLGNRFAALVRERCENVVVARTNDGLYGESDDSGRPTGRHPWRGPIAERAEDYRFKRRLLWNRA